MAKKVRVQELAIEVSKTVDAVSADIIAGTKEAAEIAVKEAADELKATSPRRTGEYASGWTYEVKVGPLGVVEARAYNEKAPQKASWLENGHEIVTHGKKTGRRSKAQRHIGPANDKAQKRFIEELKKRGI